MPVKPEANETEQDFISRCMSEEKESFPETDQRYAVCKSKWDKEGMDNTQQGGVVGMSEEFGRKKFEYQPNPKESLGVFMGRCMSNDMVREKKKDRGVRAGFCYGQYQQKYISNIAMGWK